MIVDVPDSTDDRRRPKTPPTKIYMDWWEYQRFAFMNPYTEQNNNLIYSYGRLLQAVNPKAIDLDLARLYYLSTGGSEQNQDPNDEFDWTPYKKIYANDIHGIKHWLYNAIHTTMQNFRLMFDPIRTGSNKEMSDADFLRFQDRWDDALSYVGPTGKPGRFIDLGYTSDFSEDTRHHLYELVSDITSGKIHMDDDIEVKKLKYRLEEIKMGMLQDHRSFEMTFLDEVYGAPSSVPNAPGDKKTTVTTFSVPLYSLLPGSPTVSPEDHEEWKHFMKKTYCQCRLPIYGLIFEILSGLRDVKVEGNYKDRHARFYRHDYWGDKSFTDEVEHRSQEEACYRWIQSLPSYRPEFVITLHDFSRFDYWVKRNVVTNQFDPGYLFLLDAIHAYPKNWSVDTKALEDMKD